MNTFLENTEVHFEMTVRKVDGLSSWNEKLDSDHFGIPRTNEEAVKIANNIISFFNKGLRPGETSREIVNVQRVELKVIDLIEQIDV